MKKFKVRITQVIDVELDESKFTDEFNAEYDRYFSKFGGNLELHAKQLAYQYLHETNSFYEGYGEIGEMNIKVTEPFDNTEIEVLSD